MNQAPILDPGLGAELQLVCRFSSVECGHLGQLLQMHTESPCNLTCDVLALTPLEMDDLNYKLPHFFPDGVKKDV